jgi:hypothetical protein
LANMTMITPSISIRFRNGPRSSIWFIDAEALSG